MNALGKIGPRSLFVGLVAVAVIGCAAGVQLAKDTIQDPGQLLFNGYTKPEVNCFHCHNGDGRGSGRGPDLSKAVPKMPDAQVLKIIAEGEGFMPGFGDKLDKAEQDQLLAWMRSAFGGAQAPKPAEVEAQEVE
jgi:mono/diheme cytochrome c family protein